MARAGDGGRYLNRGANGLGMLGRMRGQLVGCTIMCSDRMGDYRKGEGGRIGLSPRADIGRRAEKAE